MKDLFKPEEGRNAFHDNNQVEAFQTHKARLAFVEPIVREECAHEPMSVFDSSGQKIDGAYRNKCTICGAHLEAKWVSK